MSYTNILPITRGGTGASTASGARTSLGVPATTAVVLRDGSQAFTAAQSMGGFNLTNVADPSSAQDAATKAYVDSQIQGVTDIKQSVRAATTGSNITLSGGAPNTLDGVTLAANDRILVKDQTTASQNGLYYVSTLGTGSNGTWTRTTDADSSSEVTAGLFTFVEEGTVNADSGFILITDNPITLGTTSLTFTQFTGLGQITAGAGLTKTGNTLNVVGTTNRIDVAADSVDISTNYVGQTSITTLGTITTGTWTGTTIAVANGGTGATTASGARSNISAAPNTPQYLVSVSDGELANADVLTAGTGITVTNGTNTSTVAVDSTVVITNGTQTIDNKTFTSTNAYKFGRQEKTASYTVSSNDSGDYISMETSTASQAFTMPSASGAGLGFTVHLKNHPASTQNITVNPNGADLIENVNANYTLQPGDAVTLISNGSDEYLIY